MDYARVAERFIEEFLNQGDRRVAEELLAADFVNHQGVTATFDRAAYLEREASLRHAFPDLRFTIEQVLVHGPMVALRWTMRATHRGEFQGLPP